MRTSASISAEIAKKIRETAEARFLHRLHAILLVSKGWTYQEAGAAMGDSPRSVRRWWQSYQRQGDAGLREGQPCGRPARLTEEHMAAIRTATRRSPRWLGLSSDTWTGKALAEWLRREFSISITDRRARQILISVRSK